jgi:hypothetical protein
MAIANLREILLQRVKSELSVAAAGHPFAEIGETYQHLSDAFQGLGICELLLDMNVDRYRTNLTRSAQFRRFFLRKSRATGSSDTIFVALSRTQAVFDAVAAGDRQLAMDIRRHSPSRWMPEGEYEDDFAYHQFVHTCAEAAPELDLTEASIWLATLEGVAGDGMATRVALCDGMIRDDQTSFWAALQERLDEVMSATAGVSALEQEFRDEPWEAARTHVWIEGVAWIALARMRGWQPPDVMPLCPTPALPDSAPIIVHDLTEDLERQFGL